MKSLKSLKVSVAVGASSLGFIAQKALADTTGDVSNSVNNLAGSANAGSTDLTSFIGTIINLMLGVVGVAAVIMLIIGGFRYVFSQGNEKAVSGAKDTILYAIIGIVVAILAFAIVNFVLNGLKNA